MSNAPLCMTGLTLSLGPTKAQSINTGGLIMSRMMKFEESTITLYIAVIFFIDKENFYGNNVNVTHSYLGL